MRAVECIRPEKWGDFEDWAKEDPRRMHVDGCARCQAQRAAYLELLEDRHVPVGADPGAAAIAMRRGFSAELRRASRHPFDRLRDFLFARPVFAAAAAFASIAILWFAIAPPGNRLDRDELRGGQHTGTSAPFEGSVDVGSGALDFSWTAVPGADAYTVLLFDRELREVHRIDPIPAEQRVARLNLRETHLDPAQAVYWQVLARAGSETIASSSVRPLVSPRS